MATDIKVNSGEDLDTYFHHGNKTVSGTCGTSSKITITASDSQQSFTVPYIKTDKQGHIIEYALRTVKITTGYR